MTTIIIYFNFLTIHFPNYFMWLRLLFTLLFYLLGLGLWSSVQITLTWLFSRNQRIGFGPKWQLSKHQRTSPETLVLCQLFEFFKNLGPRFSCCFVLNFLWTLITESSSILKIFKNLELDLLTNWLEPDNGFNQCSKSIIIMVSTNVPKVL